MEAMNEKGNMTSDVCVNSLFAIPIITVNTKPKVNVLVFAWI